MSGYSHKTFLCPFFRWDERQKIHCEIGRVSFPDRASAREYTDRYCGGDWKSCTLAQAMMQYYERDEDEQQTKGQGGGA